MVTDKRGSVGRHVPVEFLFDQGELAGKILAGIFPVHIAD